MESLSPQALVLIGLCFIWSGFVRSGLGFGGSVLSLPLLLIIHNDPVVFLPIISVHLLFFSALIAVQAKWRRWRSSTSEELPPTTVNWAFLKYSIPIMLLPKLLGVAGLIVLPGDVVSLVILLIISGYSISYLLRRPIKSPGGVWDAILLAIGGYVSGISLIAAPLVVPVAASRMPTYQLRDTLLVLWFVLVAIKLIAFVASGIDLQLIHHVWLLPCAWVGHLLGERFHRYSLQPGTATFMSYVRAALLAVSVIGIAEQVMKWQG